jgi:hypothetical protein
MRFMLLKSKDNKFFIRDNVTGKKVKEFEVEQVALDYLLHLEKLFNTIKDNTEKKKNK